MRSRNQTISNAGQLFQQILPAKRKKKNYTSRCNRQIRDKAVNIGYAWAHET